MSMMGSGDCAWARNPTTPRIELRMKPYATLIAD
jgi:hypothetical protein